MTRDGYVTVEGLVMLAIGVAALLWTAWWLKWGRDK